MGAVGTSDDVTMTRGQAVTLTSLWIDTGVQVNLDAITLTVTSVDGATVYLPPTTSGITRPATGRYAYVWAPNVPPPPGEALAIWTGTDAENNPVQVSSIITVLPPSTATPTSTGFPETLADRTYVSRYATQQVGFTGMVGGPDGGVATDVDGNVVTAEMVDAVTGAVLFSRAADHLGTGIYAITLSGVETAVVGVYDVRFTFTRSGVPNLAVVGIQVGPSYPAYDSLSLPYKQMVENVWQRFADMFDSPEGGPYLQTLMQTHFTRNRLAQLARVGVGRLNTVAQPHQTYTLDDTENPFPITQWGSLLEQMTYIEVIKHLIRSYIEIPQVNLASSVSRLERRDYMQRWEQMLQIEQRDLDEMMETFKIDSMNLGASAVLVSGGAYGSYGKQVAFGGAGEAAARGYFPSRFYW